MELPLIGDDGDKRSVCQGSERRGVGRGLSFRLDEMPCAFEHVLFTAVSHLRHRWAPNCMKEMQWLDFREFSHYSSESGYNVPLKNHLPLFLPVNLEAHVLF